MPCYDKKLEAARDDLQVAGSAAVPEVDCCITSIELQQLLEQRQVGGAGCAAAPVMDGYCCSAACVLPCRSTGCRSDLHQPASVCVAACVVGSSTCQQDTWP